MGTKNTIFLFTALFIVIITTSLLVRFNDKKADYLPPTFVSESEQHNNDIAKADIAFKNGQLKDALIIYRNILTSYPNNIPLLYKIGQIYLSLEEMNAAKNIFSKLCEKSPDKVKFQTSLAFCHLELKEYEKAFEHAQKAILLRPDDGLAYIVVAAVAASQGKAEECLKTFENIQPTSFLYVFLQKPHFDPIRLDEKFIEFQKVINESFGSKSP